MRSKMENLRGKDLFVVDVEEDFSWRIMEIGIHVVIADSLFLSH